MLVGIVGKPNVGKSTFFASATLRSVPIADYPFTTIKPNVGMGYLRTKCVCKEMGVEDNPKNSVCIDGVRLIPVKLVDVAGLVEGASVGRGLGNQFLDDLRQADALIHVLDASGSTDEEGRKVGPGTHDPSGDIEMVEKELDLWILGIVEKDWEKAARIAEQTGGNIVQHLASRLTGLAIDEETIEAALLHFREKTLTSLIAANKADLPTSKPNIEKLKSGERTVIPCASEAELLLRKAAEQGLIRYTPGSNSFDVLKRDGMTPAQSRALDLVHERVLRVWGDTGVQQAIDQAYFGLLKAIVVFPVEDESKLSDKNGKVLPDAHVMKGGTTALDLARRIHSELAESFLYAIDGRSGKRLADDYGLKNGDIIKIVSSGRRS
ncbi:MAG: redox-regulated ATPase YchF [Thaumarchaeota archaeon]|nr:redox-regulated ATPase YchF [Nitrososphaerota archaeon]